MGNACVAECAACQAAPESEFNLEYALTEEFYGQGDGTGCGHEQVVSIMMADKPQELAWPRLMGSIMAPKRNGTDKAPAAQLAASSRPPLLRPSLFPSRDASPEGKELLPKAAPLKPKPIEEPAPKHVGKGTRQTGPCLELVFDAEGKEKIIQLFKRPLGAEFSKKEGKAAKIIVTKVYPRSYAWGVGLEVGWELKAIDGEEIENLKDMTSKKFHEVQTLLEKKLESLPHRPRD